MADTPSEHTDARATPVLGHGLSGRPSHEILARRLIGDEPAPVGAGVLKQWMGGTHPAFRGARRASGIRSRFSEGTRMRSLMAGSIVARQYARCRLINSPHLLLAAADLYVVVAMDPTPGAEPGHRRRAGRV